MQSARLRPSGRKTQCSRHTRSLSHAPAATSGGLPKVGAFCVGGCSLRSGQWADYLPGARPSPRSAPRQSYEAPLGRRGCRRHCLLSRPMGRCVDNGPRPRWPRGDVTQQHQAIQSERAFCVRSVGCQTMSENCEIIAVARRTDETTPADASHTAEVAALAWRGTLQAPLGANGMELGMLVGSEEAAARAQCHDDLEG